jgi:hypothetical protein
MDVLSYIESVNSLAAPALTVRAQAISPNDNGQLIYDIFFPRQNVKSVKLRDITIRNFRPAADRREWNARGRLIPIQTPDKRDLKIIPVEAYSKIDEEEMQELFENTDGEKALIQRRIGASIPERVDNLTKANYRRVELDAMSVWSRGYVDQVDPQTGRTFRTSFQIAAGRLQTALSAWNSTNAYDNLLAWVRDGISEMGPIEGVALRQATQNVIQASAPTLLNGYKPTIREIASASRMNSAAPSASSPSRIPSTCSRTVESRPRRPKSGPTTRSTPFRPARSSAGPPTRPSCAPARWRPRCPRRRSTKTASRSSTSPPTAGVS